MDWLAIVSGVLGIIAIICSVKWMQVKAVLKEAAEALVAVSEAVEDNTLTREECKKVASEFADVVLAVMKLIGKAK